MVSKNEDVIVTRSVMVEIVPLMSQTVALNELYDQFGAAVSYTNEYLVSQYDQYEELDPAPKGICHGCKERVGVLRREIIQLQKKLKQEDKDTVRRKLATKTSQLEKLEEEIKNANKKLSYQHKKSKIKICTFCFKMTYDRITLTKADGFQKELIEKFPDLAPHSRGYYAGVLKFSSQAFKSWIEKRKDMQKEAEQLVKELEVCESPLYKKKIESRLARKIKGIKNFEFRNSMIFFGSAGMAKVCTSDQLLADLEKEGQSTAWVQPDTFYLGISAWNDPKRASRVWYRFGLAPEDNYRQPDAHGRTRYNPCELLAQMAEDESWRTIMPKLVRREKGDGKYKYEIALPARYTSKSIVDRKKILELINNKKNVPVIVLSYGVFQPITAVVTVNGKIKCIKKFGNGKLYGFIQRWKLHRAKVMRQLANKIKSLHKRGIRKKKVKSKNSNRLSNYVKTNTHVLTTHAMDWIRDEWYQEKNGGCVLVMRDTTGIKRLTFAREHKRILHAWNTEMQKTFVDYKAKMRDLHLLYLRYAKCCKLTCSKCNTQIKDGTKTLSVYVQKLRLADNPIEYWSERYRAIGHGLVRMCARVGVRIPDMKKFCDDLMFGIITLEYENTMDKLTEWCAEASRKDKESAKWIKEQRAKLTHAMHQLQEHRTKKVKNFKCTHCNYETDCYVNDAMYLRSCLMSEVREAAGTRS